MTEQQVAELSNHRVPDRVVMKTCGTEASAPFPFKVYVYDRGLRAGHHDPKLSVVFEDARDRLVVSQWLCHYICAAGAPSPHHPVCRLTACSLDTAGYAGRSL
jgi:hypothetical protein